MSAWLSFMPCSFLPVAGIFFLHRSEVVMQHLTRTLHFYFVLTLVTLSLSACAPTTSPLYRDFEVTAQDEEIQARLATALQDAGWNLTESSAPNALTTEERTVNAWGMYKVVAYLEAIPMGGSYVRVYVHPFRIYFTGNRSKIPFMNSSLQREILKDIYASFDQQGLIAIGTALDRDARALARK